MTDANDPASEPMERPLSAAMVKEREDALTSSLVDEFVRARAAKAAWEAIELRTLAAAAALVGEQTARLDGRLSSAELPERAMVAELAAASRSSERTVRKQMADAADLCTRFPATVDALAAGRISRTHVGVIHEAGYEIDDDLARVGFEEAAIAWGETMTAGRLRPIVQVLAARANPRSIDERHAAARALRAVRVMDLSDGMAKLEAIGAATLMHAIMDRLTQQAKAVIKARPTGGGAAGADCAAETGTEPDARSMDELRADVFTDLLLTGTPDTCIAGDGLAAIRGTVQVTVPVLTAAGVGNGQGGEPAILAGHGPVDTDTARRLLRGAKGWERVMTDPHTGNVLAVDRYRPTKTLTRFLRARDERCRFPGCRMSVWRCDIDHTIDHAHGGPTRDGNLAHLCKGHHTLKHQTRWTVRQLAGGILEWTSPLGRVHTDRPEPTLRFTPSNDPPDPPPF